MLYPEKTQCNDRIRSTSVGWIWILVLGIGLLTGCSSKEPKVLHPLMAYKNKSCKVVFRHDVLGQADSIPSSVKSDVINGAEVSITGKLISVTNDWIEIELDDQIVQVNVSNVLFVSKTKK
jgi:hypothetical protein